MDTPSPQSPEAIRKCRQAATSAELHPESLLQIPLVRRAFTDLDFRLVERGTDAYWSYQKIIPLAVNGFNPFEGAFYYARNSLFARWLQNPFGSAREINENDLLLTEVLFMAHDYLHAWAYKMIDKLRPDMGVFSAPINAENIEEYSVCHLISEAVATAGLDYWFLSVNDASHYCDIGSISGPLTVSYREKHLPEFQRFSANFQVQTPRFLSKLTKFYCTGKFPGFDASDLRQSPRLLRWLRHELQYAVTQRQLTRSWLKFLAAEEIELAESELKSEVTAVHEFDSLIEELGQALWNLVKHDEDICGDWAPPAHRRRSALEQLPDFRFINLNRWQTDRQPEIGTNGDTRAFSYWLYQYLSAIPFTSVPQERLTYVKLMAREKDPRLTRLLTRDLPRLDTGADEPRDLFVAN